MTPARWQHGFVADPSWVREEVRCGVVTKLKTMGAAQLREVAVMAKVDPKSVRKEIAYPGKVRGDAGVRIRMALVQFKKQREAGA